MIDNFLKLSSKFFFHKIKKQNFILRKRFFNYLKIQKTKSGLLVLYLNLLRIKLKTPFLAAI